MSTISNISPMLLVSYIAIQGKEKLSPEEMFKRLSVMLGGDGSKITKDQLDDYLSKAADGQVDVSSTAYKALEIMQSNWDKISDGKDYITEGDMKDYVYLLAMAMSGGFTTSNVPESTSASELEDINNFLVASALGLDSKNDEHSKELNKILNNLLSGNSDENDDVNAEFVAAITNFLAKSFSTVTFEA